MLLWLASISLRIRPCTWHELSIRYALPCTVYTYIPNSHSFSLEFVRVMINAALMTNTNFDVNRISCPDIGEVANSSPSQIPKATLVRKGETIGVCLDSQESNLNVTKIDLKFYVYQVDVYEVLVKNSPHAKISSTFILEPKFEKTLKYGPPLSMFRLS